MMNGSDPTESRRARAEHDAKAHQPVQRRADAEVHQVLHQDVARVLRPREARFARREASPLGRREASPLGRREASPLGKRRTIHKWTVMSSKRYREREHSPSTGLRR